MLKPHDRVNARLVLIYGVAVLAGFAGLDRVQATFDDVREWPVLLSKPYSEFALASHIAQVLAEEAE